MQITEGPQLVAPPTPAQRAARGENGIQINRKLAMDDETFATGKQRAAELGMSFSAYVRGLIWADWRLS